MCFFNKFILVQVILMALVGTCAFAHTIQVDGSSDDWDMDPPGNIDDVGIIARNPNEEGEYVWRDRAGDERTDFGTPDPMVDLVEFRVTSSPSGLNFLGVFGDVQFPGGSGSVQLQIALDMDQQPLAGELWLANFADTQVSPEAGWEYLISTRFASGSLAPHVFDQNWNDLAQNGIDETAISVENNCVEIHVGWDSIGGPPMRPIRFTVAVFRSGEDDMTWGIPGMSNALDAITNYGLPGMVANTMEEVGDGVVDSFFDIWFHLDPDLEPSSPLIISEVLYDAVEAEPMHEWFEIYNMTGEPFSLNGFRIGDEEMPGGGEGMMAFPPEAFIEPGQPFVVANNGFEFASTWPVPADFELVDSDPMIPDLVPAEEWASGNIQLSNSGDELLLLDRCWTILDVVTWENGEFPGIEPAQEANAGQSIARSDPVDTDNCSMDFQVLDAPAPGILGPVSNAPSSSLTSSLHLHQNYPNPFNPVTTIEYELPAPGTITLTIFNMHGQQVRALLAGQAVSGRGSVIWDGCDDAGSLAATGMYLYRLESLGYSASKKMLLLK